MKTFFERKQWIKYRLTAFSRHGIHSPFAYHFSEKVLYKQSRKQLKQRITAYFSDYTIVWNDWQLAATTENTVHIFEHIHQSEKTVTAWETVVANPAVKMSIDVFDFGLLFFKEAFKEKQHFVLR